MAQAPANIVSLDGDLTPFLDRFKLPAVAAAVAKNGKIVAAGAVGTRRIGTDTPVTINDRFHIGSDTKAMTSLLAAMLVEEGKLRWNTTVGEIYPELVGKMSKGVKDITLEQLLSHTSGIAGDSMEHITQIVGWFCTQPLSAGAAMAALPLIGIGMLILMSRDGPH